VLDGVEVWELRIPKYRGKSTWSYIRSYLRFLWSSALMSLRLLRLRQLHVVHVHNLPDFLVLAGLIPRFAGCKVVLDVHDSLPETYDTKFPARSVVHKALYLEEKVSAFLAHRVICVNHPQRDVLVSRGIPRRKTLVAMNAPDPRLFGRSGANDAGTERADKQGRFDLVYHGTIVQRLGVDLIIRAVGELRDRIPDLHLHLWGSGDDLSDFEALASDLGLSGRVTFKPQGFPLQHLPNQLRRMDVGVVGNRRSVASDLMLPVKLMEYVALGIPAVVPRLPAIAHYFTDNMVSYYEPEDVRSMTDAVFRLYEQPELRARQAARAKEVFDVCGWDRQGPELVGLYRKLVGNSS
jgi:glycosyltransferase involved in cell wall biosynthesis